MPGPATTPGKKCVCELCSSDNECMSGNCYGTTDQHGKPFKFCDDGSTGCSSTDMLKRYGEPCRWRNFVPLLYML